MKLRSTLLCIVCLWGTHLLAQVQLGAVLPFENETKDASLDWIGESFAEMLSSELNSSRLMMIDRRERAAAFDSLGVPDTRILSIATVYKAAEVLDADKVVIGSYQFQEGVFSATAQILDMTGPSLSTRFTESGPLASLLELQSGLAWQLRRSLRPDFPLTKDEYVAEREVLRLDAFENYVRGLIASEKAQRIQYFRTAQRLEPRFTKSAFELGMIYFKDQDYRTSIPWLAKLRKGDPDYLEANYFLGLAYFYLKEYENSTTAFRVVEQELPLNEVYNNLGIAQARLNRAGAIQYFEKAFQSNPADTDFRFNLAYAQLKRGSYAEANETLTGAEDPPDLPEWRAIRAQCLQQLGRKEESEQELALLVEEHPEWANGNDPARLQDLERPKDSYDGVSFRQLQRLVELQEEIKHAKLSLSDHVELHFQEARQFLEEGSDREAAEELQVVIDYDAENASAYRELAKVHLRGRQLDEALKCAKYALRWEPSAESHLLLARIYMEQGKLEDSQAQIETALKLDPSNTSAASLREELNSRSVSRP
jgi:tetratricopeptide (TPR) repeat protein